MRILAKPLVALTMSIAVFGGGAAAAYAAVTAGPTYESGSINLSRSEGASFIGSYQYDCPTASSPYRTGVCVKGLFKVWNAQAANLEARQMGYGYTMLSRLISAYPGQTVTTGIDHIISPGDTLWAKDLRVKLCRDRPIVADCVEGYYPRTIARS